MAEMMIAGSILSASFKVLFERLACPLFLKFFESLTHHKEGDKLLKKLRSKLLRLSVVLNDAEKQQFTNQLVKDWLDELKDAIYHADDLLDEIATKALGCKVEAEYRSAVKNQVGYCRGLNSLPEGMHSHLPCLEELIIWYSPEIESFPEGGLPSNLRQLQIWDCEKVVARRREWGLQRLPSLIEFTLGGGRYEEEDDDDMLGSFLEEGLLPPTLAWLSINYLRNLKSINYQGFQHLTCLKVLRINKCPQLQSLPEEGFLPSLHRLEIKKCPLLKPRCERDRGDEWHKIAHIPFIRIDDEVIF